MPAKVGKKVAALEIVFLSNMHRLTLQRGTWHIALVILLSKDS